MNSDSTPPPNAQKNINNSVYTHTHCIAESSYCYNTVNLNFPRYYIVDIICSEEMSPGCKSTQED